MGDTSIGVKHSQPTPQHIWTKRREGIRNELRRCGAYAVISGPGSDMTYLLGGHSIADERPCLLLTTVRGDALFLPRLAAEELSSLSTGMDVRAWDDGESVLHALSQLFDGLEVPRNAELIVDPTIRADTLLLIQAVRPQARTVVTPALVAQARAIKSDLELSQLRAAADLADRAVAYAWSMVREGISERELSALVRAFHEQHGGNGAFAGVSFGDHSALPHHTPGDRRLSAGSAILLDTGSSLGGYTSDITRMAWFGSTPAPEFVHQMESVELAVKAAYAAAVPGVTGGTVDAAARKSLTIAGFEKEFVHRTGHGIGLSIHEAPYLTPGSNDLLVPGATFTIEPGVYRVGHYGVRLEDSVAMADNGPAALTSLSRALTVIEE